MSVDVTRDDDGIARVVLNRPEVMNALDLAMLDALAAAWQELEADDNVRVVIVTGAGDRAFCAGADLKNFAPAGTTIGPVHPAFFPDRVMTKPLVAAVNGYAIAGGAELLGATDIRVAADHASFAISEAAIGLFPAGGSAVRYPRQLPWPQAMELLLTGRRISAQEALAWGMLNKVVPAPQLMDAADGYARSLLACSPVSVRAIKECALRTAGMRLEEAFDAQIPFIERVLASEDAKEGPRAFAERRTPEFRGR